MDGQNFSIKEITLHERMDGSKNNSGRETVDNFPTGQC